MTIKREGDDIIVERPNDSREAKAYHASCARSSPTWWRRVCRLLQEAAARGVGYRAALKGKDLEMQLGFSHPVLVEAPENITFECPARPRSS